MEIITFSAESKVEGNTLVGTAHVFGQKAEMSGDGKDVEVFTPGAFDEVLKTSDVRAFVQHNHEMLLGRQSSGTLRLFANDKSIDYEIDLPDTSYAHDLRTLVERGDINEMSFGFIPGKYKIERQDGVRVRNHIQVREFVDVSTVAIPAFGGTSIQLRNKSFDNETLRSQLARIRAHNYSKEMK